MENALNANANAKYAGNARENVKENAKGKCTGNELQFRASISIGQIGQNIEQTQLVVYALLACCMRHLGHAARGRQHVMPHIILNQKWAQFRAAFRFRLRGGTGLHLLLPQAEALGKHTERKGERGRHSKTMTTPRVGDQVVLAVSSACRRLRLRLRLQLLPRCLPDSLQSAAIKLTKCWLLHTALMRVRVRARARWQLWQICNGNSENT